MIACLLIGFIVGLLVAAFLEGFTDEWKRQSGR